MLQFYNSLSPAWQWSLIIAALALAISVFIYVSGAVRYIPNDRLGVLEKLWSLGGSVSEGFIALNGEAGFQPDTVRGGFHFFVPFQFRVHKVALVSIPQGQIGHVYARDGVALAPEQTLARNDQANNFENVRDFLAKGGQKGPQRKILREGVYAINLAQFVVLTATRNYSVELAASDDGVLVKTSGLIAAREGFEPIVIKDEQDVIGVVTVHDGPALPEGEIIAPTVGAIAAEPEFHNNFQNPQAFLRAGGFRGRQHQVLVDGSYYINRLFATVELVPKTVIEVGTVGVVISYTGPYGDDISGDNYRHGELVAPGQRGVWSKPLLPGKYAFNTFAGKIVTVPTTNFVLKWTSDQTGPHHLDENLSEIGLITKDAFEPLLPLSVVVHIDYMKAPLVVQRFGDVKRLVEQTLDPMVSAYFKNIGQTKTLIELLQERSDIQRLSSEEMREKFAAYSLDLQEVLIGTPRAEKTEGQTGIEQILLQLRQRQIAVEKVETYKLQEVAAVQERTLREKEAMAQQQADITASSLAITLRENEGKAKLAQTHQEAEAVQVAAKASGERVRLEGQGDADRIRFIGLADAEKIRATGLAQAEATEKQVAAYGGPQYQLNSQVLLRFAEAVEKGQLPLVPHIVVGGGEGKTGGNGLVEMLLTMLVAEKSGDKQRPPKA